MLRARKNPKRRATRLRNAERTRERLLQAAFREIYRSGFQSASLDTILASTGVTKGALYYHFKSKEALGYAIVEEIIGPDCLDKWLRPLQRREDPIDTLIGIVQGHSVRPADVRGGCPLNNLAQETKTWLLPRNSRSISRRSQTLAACQDSSPMDAAPKSNPSTENGFNYSISKTAM